MPGVNIAYMQVGRKTAGGRAVMVLSVDNAIPQEILGQLAQIGRGGRGDPGQPVK